MLLGMWEICNKLNICFFGVLFDYRYIKLYIYYDIRVYVYVYMLGILIVKLVLFLWCINLFNWLFFVCIRRELILLKEKGRYVDCFFWIVG